jgi:uncharacterized protein
MNERLPKLDERYQLWIKTIISKRLVLNEIGVCLFGSAVDSNRLSFFDVDIGVTGDFNRSILSILKDDFTNSTFPFMVDIIDLDSVSGDFRSAIFKKDVLWLTSKRMS